MTNRFQQTLDYLYSLLPMFQRQGAVAFKKDLSNTRKLCWALGQPHWRFPSVHVAGTNGKGSVSSMIAAVLSAAGFRTGLYTSPHLISFTERIRIDGKEIPPEDVVAFVDRHHKMIEEIRPSFFELTVAMAFEHFARQQIDIAVVEVGMGGRLDSTNIIRPELSVITNIGFDHMEFLGDTLDKIAGEKAGIIKPYTPVVIGERHPETDPVFEKIAAKQKAPLFFAQDEFSLKRSMGNWQGQTFDLNKEDYPLKKLTIDLLGKYQQANLVTALTALDVLRRNGRKIEPQGIQDGLKSIQERTGLLGRMHKLGEAPLILCDTAHNEAGLALVIDQLSTIPRDRLFMVLGMVADKAHDRILSILPKEAHYIFTRPDIPRGLDAEALAAMAKKFELQGEVVPRVPEALKRAKVLADSHDLIFVGGSTFVVADLLASEKSNQ